MEFLLGSDFGQILHRNDPLPISEAVGYVLQACEAIAEAHSLGIVHRDLKPANLFLSQRKDGSALVKVLDFGISKTIASDGEDVQASMTATSAVMGSPMYMSPEQMRSSKKVDARTDIWSLGGILYELLVGRPVFDAASLPELCSKIALDPPPPLRAIRAEIPEELEAVVVKCLAKDMTQRFQNVGELATALLPFGPKGCRASVERIVFSGNGGSSGVASPPLPPESEPLPAAQTVRAWGATRKPSGHSRSPLAFAIFAGALVLGLTLLFLLQLRSAAKPAAQPIDSTPVITASAPPVSPSASTTQESEHSAAVSPSAAASTTSAIAATTAPPSGRIPGSRRSPQGVASPAGTPAAQPAKALPVSSGYNPLDHL